MKGNADHRTSNSARRENYERPDRDQFTELPGSDKRSGGKKWRKMVQDGLDPDEDDGTTFPLQYQGRFYNFVESVYL